MKIIRNCSIIALFGLSAMANAALPGGYLGLGLGGVAADAAYTITYDIGSVYTSGTFPGFGGQIFGGYNFNKYVGLEASLLHTSITTDTFIFPIFFPLPSAYADYDMNIVTLVGKAYLPLGNFNLYALGGFSYINNQITYRSSWTDWQMKETKQGIRPTYGLGASYSFNKHISTGLEFRQIYSGNTESLPKMNMLMLNVSYSF